MQIERFVVNFVEENCYLLWDEQTLEAALIDCGARSEEEQRRITGVITEKNLTLTHLLQTHGHFDHLFGAYYIYKEYDICPELHTCERETYEKAAEQMQQFIHRSIPLTLPPVQHWLSGGEEIKVGSIVLRVIPTPGHTPGGVCFYAEKEATLFSGDSLFCGSIGRCDLPGGNETQLIAALREKILPLPDDVQVLPGHGNATSIGYERKYNYYLR